MMTMTIERVRAFNGLDVLVARDEGLFAGEGLVSTSCPAPRTNPPLASRNGLRRGEAGAAGDTAASQYRLVRRRRSADFDLRGAAAARQGGPAARQLDRLAWLGAGRNGARSAR